jgi:hypothetical protein
VTKVLLPLSEATIKEIMHQVIARGAPEWVITYEGKNAVDLGSVVVVADPDRIIKEH